MAVVSQLFTRGSRQWRIVGALAITTTVGYGVLVYAFAVFMVPMQHDLHASRTVIAGAQTTGVLSGALAAVLIGRLLDRGLGRGLMVAGSLSGTALLYAWSRVDSVWMLYLVTALLGVAGAGVLYEAAFAVVVRWFRAEQRSTAILVITLVGGLASTIFFPLTGFLVEAYGWRIALVWLAVIFGVVTLPLHLVVRNPPGYAADHAVRGEPGASRESRKAAVRAALRDRTYWLLALSFVAEGAANAIVALHLVAYLIELGHPPGFAATIAGLLGLLSVTGRLVTTALQRRRSLTSVVSVIFLVQAVGAGLLPLFGGDVVGAIVCIIGFGIGQGVSTIARPVILAERYSLRVYGTLSGILAGLMLGAKAFAPLGAAGIHELTGGYVVVMVVCAVCCVIGAVCLIPRLSGRTSSDESSEQGQES